MHTFNESLFPKLNTQGMDYSEDGGIPHLREE